ncbi:MAG: hypothetical protein RBS43_08415, partial [Candidatus Cloacimonas sp.]|nr:hypothetical protein [Candidatus Cloacimonas sp.]
MNAQGRTLRVVMLIAAIQLFFCILSAETIFNETMGAASTITEVPDYTGWYNYGSANYSGTADARSTWNSAGDYTGASGAGNIYFVGDMDDYYQISGINTSGYRNIRLSLALYKSNSNSTTGNAENGSNFNISYSVDSGISWRRLPITIPTGGSSTEIYYWRELSEYLPATDNLTLRFTNIGASEPVHFRMDDVTLNGDKDSILTETIGLGAANEEIALFNGWSNSSPITFSGSGYVRSDLPSTDKYTGATGGGNVLLDSGQYFQISGVNTLGYTQPALSVGVMKASAAENGSRLLMSYSTDGLVWSTPQLCTTTASGTNIWYRKHFSGLPLAGNLYLKFSNISSAGSSFRIDDIRLFSSLNAPVIGFPASYSISATGATLSANIGGLNGANVTQRGFYYSTTANFADGTGTVVTEAVSISQPGSYSLATGVLLPNTVYYYKAFATSSSGTSYSGQNTFTTLPVSTTTTFTLDNTLPTGGANFQTYGEAVTYLNANFAASSTGFTFLVKDGQEFADTSTSNYFITASGTAAKQIIFQRDNSGSTRPKLSRTSTSNNVVVLSGADWVTFDGIDVKVAGSYGFHLVNNGSSTTNGSQHNTIKNCTVTGGGTSTGSAGVSHTYSATPTSAAGKHSYNVFQNIAVKSIRNGIVLNGVASEIEISGCSITSIGSTSSCTGIKTTDITNLKVFNNLVNSLLTWFSFPIGINIASCKGNVDVYNNKISNLDGFYDETESLVFVAGIQVIPAAEESNIRIYNNMIWNLSDGYSGVSAEMSVRGIYIDSGYINGSLSIDYNTIRIPNNTRKAAGIRLSSPYANIRNNVISMNTTNQTYKVYGIYYDNLSQLNGVTDSNVIYLSNPALGCYIYANGTNYTLEGWQNTTGREAASWIYDPKLISTSNLHITPGADTPVESNASNYNGSISWVTHDIDGDLRNMSTPDIGADEGTFTFTIPQIPANPLSLTATAINAGEFIFSASANQAGNSILIAYNTSNTFGIPGGGYTAGATIQGGGTVAYMGNTQDLGLIPGFSPSTAYYFKAWSYATTDRTTYYLYSSGITITGSTPAPIAFPSVVTVNPSGSGTFNFNSLTQALHDIKLGIIPTRS